MPSDEPFEILLDQPFGQALAAVEATLAALSFSVITRVDVQRMMKEKLNVEFHPYVILGACDTPIAHRALAQDPSIGLMLPNNVSIEGVNGEQTLVRVADPVANLGCRGSENETLTNLAEEASARLSEIIVHLRATSRPGTPEAKPWDRLASSHHE